MESTTDIQFPRIAIKFCVQCKWNLRAAYYAQELLQTFSNTIGEISLIPVTGGIFTITLYDRPANASAGVSAEGTETQRQGEAAREVKVEEHLIWDRKRDSGFPETKELKNRVRNVIDPQKDMGHVDRALRKGQQGTDDATTASSTGLESAQIAQPASTSKLMATTSSDHAGHQKADAAVEDCEECKAVVAEAGKKLT